MLDRGSSTLVTICAMKGTWNLRSNTATRLVVPRLHPSQAHIKFSPVRFPRLSVSALPKEDETPTKVPSEPTTVVPSVRRRLALMGAAAPCLCAFCCGGIGAAKAVGRNPLYDRYFATVMRYGMDDYEAAIRPLKTALFDELIVSLLQAQGRAAARGDGSPRSSPADGSMRVLELGIGTGPNFPFYAAALASAAEGQPTTTTTEADPTLAGCTATVDTVTRSDTKAGKVTPAAACRSLPIPRRLHIVGLDPNPEMLHYAAESATGAGMNVIKSGDGGEDSSSNNNSGRGRGADRNGTAAVGAGGDVGPLEVDVSLVQGSAETLPFGEDEFDAAVVTLVMCSVPSPAKALVELRRVVRPTGRLLLIEHVAAGRGRPGLRLAQSLLTPLQQLLADGCHLNRDTAEAVRGAGWGGKLRTFELQGFSLLAPHIAGLLEA